MRWTLRNGRADWSKDECRHTGPGRTEEGRMSPARRSAFQVLFVILLAGCCMLVAFDSLRARSSARPDGPLEDENNRWIRLTGHTFDPLHEHPALAPNLRSKEPGPDETVYCIVQFNDLVTPAMR